MNGKEENAGEIARKKKFREKSERGRKEFRLSHFDILDEFSANPEEYSKTFEITEQDPKEGEEQGVRKSLSLVEAAGVNLFIDCGKDTFQLMPDNLSADVDPGYAAYEDPKIVIAGIGMNRNDIGQRREQKTFDMHAIAGGKISRINTAAKPKFNKKQWESDRLDCIDKALGEGANIISLGEFDYPPFTTQAADRNFEKALQSRIDAVDRPVIVVAGSRHGIIKTEIEDEKNEMKTTEKCVNRARIFANGTVCTADEQPRKMPIVHDKLVSAIKAGEQIAPPSKIDFPLYNTNIGNISVLICVDAYNPSVIFSFLATRAWEARDKPGLIIVPSYNKSAKMYYSCQVLSMFCSCPVVFVDACNHTENKRHPKPDTLELFIFGRRISDICASATGFSEDNVGLGNATVKLWSYDDSALRDLRKATTRGTTPFFDQVDELMRVKTD